MLTPGQIDLADAQGMLLLPAPKHILDIHMVGLARLKYRARTSATAVWLGNPDWAAWTAKYDALEQEIIDNSKQFA